MCFYLAGDLVTDIRCQPKTHPCPHCGKRGRRVRRMSRPVHTLAYKWTAWLLVHYAEYRARCACCHSFRSWPLTVPAKADYDEAVRNAVLDRILSGGLNDERTRRAMRLDFLLVRANPASTAPPQPEEKWLLRKGEMPVEIGAKYRQQGVIAMVRMPLPFRCSSAVVAGRARGAALVIRAVIWLKSM